jgi:hypothetical protein
MAAILQLPSWIKKMNNAGNIACGSEVGHQISKGLVEWFKSYRDLKNPRWPLACGRHLGFLKI